MTLKASLKPHDDPALKYDTGARNFIATMRIQRSAFNMTDYQSMVDDDVDIEIDAIVRPDKTCRTFWPPTRRIPEQLSPPQWPADEGRMSAWR